VSGRDDPEFAAFVPQSRPSSATHKVGKALQNND
jgi:hypothetical protein